MYVCMFLLLIVTPITCVLVRYYPHHHCFVGGELVVHHVIVCFQLPSTHIAIDPSNVSVVISSSHCCFWFVVLNVPWWSIRPIALCKWWNLFKIKNKGKNKFESIQLFCFLVNKFFSHFFFIVYIYIYIYNFLLTIHDDATKWFSKCDHNHYYLWNKWKQGFFCKFNLCFKA